MENFKFTFIKNQLSLLLGVCFLFIGLSAQAQTYTRTVAVATTLETITTPVVQNLTDDQFVTGIPMGFNFPYYGGNYNTIDVNANGFVRFTPNVGVGGFSNQGITVNCGTNFTNLIAPLWDDWNSDAGTSVTWGPIAGGGFAVTWVRQGASYLGGTAGDYATFQVVLRPTGVIDIVLNDISIGTGTGNNGATATVGINGNNATECDQYSFNAATTAGTVTYTPNNVIVSMVATPVTTCSNNGTTYNQPVAVNFRVAPLAGTVFQVCYNSACVGNQATNSAIIAAPYVCQTFMSTGSASQTVTLANVPCQSQSANLYGTLGVTGPSQPIYVGCVGMTTNFTQPAGLPCELVCPGDATYYLGSLECCAPAAYDLATRFNCLVPFSSTTNSLQTAISTDLIDLTTPVTGGGTATVTGNVINLGPSTPVGAGTATAALALNSSGQISLNWSFNSGEGSFWDPFTWQLVRGNTVVSQGGTANLFTTGTNAESGVINTAVMAGDVLILRQSNDGAPANSATVVTFNSIQAAGLVEATPVVVTGPEPGECVAIGDNPVQINLINPFSGEILETCNFTLTAIENQASGSLSCNGQINISLADDCTATIEPDDVLEGSQYSCADNYVVGVSKGQNGPWTEPAVINQLGCGDWFYRVRDITTGNSCWGRVKIEDKLAPELACGSCGGILSGVLETTDTQGDFTGFGAAPGPQPGGNCGASLFTSVDYVSFTISPTTTGPYRFDLTGSVPVTNANFNSQLGIALYSAQPDPNNSCTNMLITDGQSLNPVTTTINSHFNSVTLVPGTTYWISVQMPRHALGAASQFPNAWTVNVTDIPTGESALSSPENCAIDCIDKDALLGYVAQNTTASINNIVNVCGIPRPEVVTGYCGVNPPVWSVRLVSDNSNNCGGFLTLEWKITEACGMSATVQCNVKINAQTFDDVFVPEGVGAPVFLECNDGTSPEAIEAKYGVTFAWPYFIDKAGNPRKLEDACNFYSAYTDIEFEACAPHCHGNKKVVRRWTILDWCSGELAEATQIIKAVDQTPPTFITKDTTVSTRPWDCTGEFFLPLPWELHDNCDANPTYVVTGPQGVVVTKVGNRWRASNVEKGVYTFVYIASDCCGNKGSESVVVTVLDKTPPIAIAKQDIVISLVPGYEADGSLNGQAKMFPGSIDNGSFDNCSDVKLEIRRPDGAPACGNDGNITNPATGARHNNNVTFSNSPLPGFNNNINDTDGGEFVKFCCADIPAGETFGIVQVELRVWDDGNMNGIIGDAGDNYNVTWANVRVEYKVPPQITCPPDMTIYCDWAIDQNPGTSDASAKSIEGFDFTKTGLPTAVSVCGTSDIRFWDRVQVNQCKIGTITRTFLVGTSGVKCVQNIKVDPSLASQPWTFIPSSLSETPIAITSCDGPTAAQIAANAPRYTSGPCDNIGVSTDVKQFDFEQGVCRKWRVEFIYDNWCTDEKRGPFYKYFVYNDVVAPELECEDKMFPVDNDCVAQVVLTKTAIDTSGCIQTGWLKWEVYVDLWADGTNDYLFTSFYAGADGAVRIIDGDAVRQYKLSGPTTNAGSDGATQSGQELRITLPDLIEGSMSNHKVVWKVTDGCHNYTSCHENFMVADKKKPTPVCVPLSTALMADPDGNGPFLPMVELWAVDFMNKAYDNCTEDDKLLYTFDNVAPQVENKTVFGRVINIDVPHYFNAASGGVCAYPAISASEIAIRNQYLRGENGLQLWLPESRSSAKVWTSSSLDPTSPDGYTTVDVMVTVWDKKFNWDFCWTSLKLGLHDDEPGTGSIAGRVATSEGKSVGSVTVSIDANLPEFPKAATTPANGTFGFATLVEGLAYEIEASKGGSYSEGVSTLDLVLIQRHILGVQALNDSYKLIAADANNDGAVTASDLIELRKLILGLTSTLNNNTSWRFAVAGTPVNVNPISFDERINVNPLTGEIAGQDFVAIKIGDVNGNASTDVTNPTVESRSNNDVNLTIAERAVEAGETVAIPVTAANFNEVFGYQFTMNLNGASFVGVESGAIEMNANNVGVLSNDVVTMSFASNEAVSAKGDDVLFTMIVKANKAGNVSEMMTLNSDVTATESYVGAEMTVGKVSLNVRTADVAAAIELFQNEPNPFKGQTTVSFNMPSAAKASLSVYDVTGKLVTVRNIDAVKGYNSEIFTTAQLGTSGVLYYTLVSGDFTATKKMIIIE